MRRTHRGIALAALACALAATGCSQDVGKRMMSDTALQGRVMDMIASNPTTAAAMSERLAATDSTRAIVIQKLVGNAGGAQQVMDVVAKDQILMDGALNEAMKDPVMRTHVITLFKGMQMAGVR